MAKKKANSSLPHELNENWGSNYMMDGFWHDMEYQHGLGDNPPSTPIPQPSTYGFAQLPDGVIMATTGPSDSEDKAEEMPVGVDKDPAGLPDLGSLGIVAAAHPDVDRSDVGIVDFGWLAEAYQDPNRLPDKPVDNGLPELQEAWGDRTDGIRSIDLLDRNSIRYEDARQDEEDDDPLNRDKFAHLVQSAMRRSAAGESLSEIRERIVQVVPPKHWPRLAKAMKAIELEHGLTGNVYVRASAYPGLHQGKWAKSLKKASTHARYLIACEGQDCSGCACALGLKVINHPREINWDREFEHYAPRLEVTGRLDRTASLSSNKKEVLRAAFLSHEKAPKTHIESTKVSPVMPVDRVSSEEARRAFAQHQPRREIVKTDEPKIEEAKLAKKLGALAKAQLITMDEYKKLASSKAPSQVRLRMAGLLAARTKQASYSGHPGQDHRVRISQQEFEAATNIQNNVASDVRVASVAEEAERHRLLRSFSNLESEYHLAKQKAVRVARAVKDGVRGSALRNFVSSTLTDREKQLVAKELDPFLIRGGFYDKDTSNTYQGAVIKEASAQKAPSVVSPQEINRLTRWAQQQLTEGFSGLQLDDLLNHRFTAPVVKAASENLVQIRKKHEGLSGFTYVDAEAYASKKGSSGCDKGALKHRTNGLKYVLAMPRCGSCVFKNADGVCQKYNKTLVDEVENSPVWESVRKANLRASNMTDQEATASLFNASNANPVREYQLQNDLLDDIGIDEIKESSEISQLQNIFFGGFEV
jgi:hypothetical protein